MAFRYVSPRRKGHGVLISVFRYVCIVRTPAILSSLCPSKHPSIDKCAHKSQLSLPGMAGTKDVYLMALILQSTQHLTIQHYDAGVKIK